MDKDTIMSQENETFSTPFPSSLRDDLFKRLASIFLMTGKGRRPNLPSPVPSLTNKLLCQLHLLKDDGNATWNDVHDWFTKIHPGQTVTVSQLQHRCQNAWKTASDLLLDGQCMDFINTDVHFCEIPSVLIDVGLSRSILLSASGSSTDIEYSPPQHFVVTNDFVFALEKFRSKESLPVDFINRWLQIFLLKLSSPPVSRAKIVYKLSKMLKQLKTLKKSNENFYTFLNQPFFEPTSKTDSTEKKSELLLLKKQEKKLAVALEETNSLKSSNNVLKEIINELQDKPSVHRLNKGVQVQIKSKEEDQYYLNSIKLLENKIDELSSTIDNQNDIILKLKQQVKSEQTQKSNYKQKYGESILISEAILNAETENVDCSPIDLKSTGNVNNAYSDDVHLTYMALQGEADVAASKCSSVINIVSKYLYRKEIPLSSLPNVQTSLNMSNAGNFLSKTQIVESILDASHFTLATDETSRQKRRYLENHIVLSNGCTMSLGFNEIASENADTLLEKAIEIFSELSDIYCKANEEVLRDSLFKEILMKLKCLMSDRAAVMKLFDKKMACYKNEVLGTDCSTHFLFCNAHFLLGLASAAESSLKEVEAQLGIKLGRDKCDKFSCFKNSSETAALRVIRAAADVFGPRGDEKNGCRSEWQEFLEHENVKSKFTSYRTNRFNNVFHNASALVYHRDHIMKFLKRYVSHDNLKLQSILEDISDSNVMILVSALAKMNCLVTSPYWLLMNSSKSYADFPSYVQLLSSFFEKQDCNADVAVFSEFDSNEFCLDVDCDNELYNVVLKSLYCKFNDVLKRQLSDFIGEGLFAGELDSDVSGILSTCPLSNLTGERLFGDLDYDMSKRRRASLLLRSSLNMWKHNKTGSWLCRKKKKDAIRLLNLARKEGKHIRQRDREKDRRVRNEIRERLMENERKMHEKEIREREKHLNVVNAVISQGGVCTTKEEVDELISRGGNRVEGLKMQIRYRKLVLQEKDLSLSGNFDKLYQSLISCLGSGEFEPPRKRLN